MFQGVLFVVAFVFQSIVGKIFPPKPETPSVICTTKRLIINIPSLQLFHPLASGSIFHTISSAIRPHPGMQLTKQEHIGGGEIVIDWINPNSSKGTVILFPGLGGNSLGIHMTYLSIEIAKRGFAIAVYNRRGHANGSVLNHKFPEHANIEETKMAVDAIARKGTPLYAVGISAGANAMIRYIGSTPGSSILAAVSICNVLDLNKSYEKLRNNKFLDSVVTNWVKSIYEKHYGALTNINNMKHFDEYVTGKPVDEYYDEQSSKQALLDIQIPVLCISSRNDMIVDKCICDIQDEIALQNPNVVSVTTIDGGHCGWMTKEGGWAEKVAAEWLDVRRRDIGKWTLEKA